MNEATKAYSTLLLYMNEATEATEAEPEVGGFLAPDTCSPPTSTSPVAL